MKRYLFSLRRYFFLCTMVLFPAAGQGQWQSIGPGAGSDLLSIAIHPENPDVVYVGGDIQGVFKTTDGGNTWRMVNRNLATGPWTPDVYWINQIVFDQSDTSYNSLFLCTAVGLFTSRDGGESWSLLLPVQVSSEEDFLNVTAMAQVPGQPHTLYAGTEGLGVYKSSDGGANWTKLPVSLPAEAVVYGIVVAPDGTVVLGTTKGVRVSTDGGATWQPRNNGLPHQEVWNLKGLQVGETFRLYGTLITRGTQGNAGTFQGGLYVSDDLGQSWQERNGNLPRMQSDGRFYFYQQFAVNPLNPQTIYIGTTLGYPNQALAAYEDWGIYRSYDGGQTWQRIDTRVEEGWMDQTFFNERHALILAMAPSDTSILYWGRDWVYRTDDAGATWTQVYTRKTPTGWQGRGMELMMVESLAFFPSRPGTLFVGYDDMGPFRSIDGGSTFMPMDPYQDPYEGYDAVKEILIDPDNGDMYISRYDGFGAARNYGFDTGKIFMSRDLGKTWVDLSAGLPDGRPHLAVDFSSGSPGKRTLYAASYNNGVYKFTGNTWTPINQGLGSKAAKAWTLLIHPSNPAVLYLGLNGLGTGGGLYQSADGGASWSRLSTFPDLDVLCLVVDPATGALYAAGTENYDWSHTGGLYRSTDGGATWERLTDLPRVVDVAVHPSNSDILYIGQQPWYSVWQPDVAPGIYRSTDGGKTWENITGDLGHTFVLFVTIDPRPPHAVYVGTGGGGLWRLTEPTAVEARNTTAPLDFALYQNYPNPFNPMTTLELSLPRRATVNLVLYDRTGRMVRTLLHDTLPAGVHRVILDASDLAAGVYFIRMKTAAFSVTRKIVLVK